MSETTPTESNDDVDPIFRQSDFDGGVKSDLPLVTQSGEEFSSRGKTVIRTRAGYAFAPSDKDLPLITAAGVTVSAEEAEAIMAEANEAFGDGHVTIVHNTDNDGE